MKKFFAMLLAIMMLLALAAPAYAADGDDVTETGSITINGVIEKNAYEIYKILDLESYNVTSGAYSY